MADQIDEQVFAMWRLCLVELDRPLLVLSVVAGTATAARFDLSRRPRAIIPTYGEESSTWTALPPQRAGSKRH